MNFLPNMAEFCHLAHSGAGYSNPIAPRVFGRIKCLIRRSDQLLTGRAVFGTSGTPIDKVADKSVLANRIFSSAKASRH